MLATSLVMLLAVALLLGGAPVAFAFGLAAFILAVSLGTPPQFFVSASYTIVMNFVLLAIPLFIMAGGIMEAAGLADRLLQFANSLVGRLRGGLAAATLVTIAIFGAISGSAAANLAAIGSIIIPRAQKEGYPRGYITGLVAAASTTDLLIPPSVTMILFGVMTEQSVAALFLATAIPGLMIIFNYIIINFWLCRKMPSIKVMPKVSFKEQGKGVALSTWRALFALLMPLIILGGIFGGVFSPTEAAAVAVVYALFVGMFVYRGLTLRSLGQKLLQTSSITGAIMILLLALLMLSRILVYERFPQQVAELLVSVFHTKWAILIMINIFLLILGMILDDASGMILAAIILMPVAKEIGIHPIQLGAIVGVNLGLGNFTPPVAPLLYMAGAVGGKVPLQEYMGTTFRFLLLGHVPVLILTTYVPAISLYLPQLLLGIK